MKSTELRLGLTVQYGDASPVEIGSAEVALPIDIQPAGRTSSEAIYRVALREPDLQRQVADALRRMARELDDGPA